MLIIKTLIFIGLSFVALMLFVLAYRIYKIPDSVWERNRKNPCRENFREVLFWLTGE